tara:strand:- start:4255 stop:4419 length:165 start_codon:yes stop_codon:yes gene_type:complete
MNNLLLLAAGFIAYPIIKYLYNSLLLWMAFRKRRNIWVRSNFNKQITYNKKIVR